MTLELKPVLNKSELERISQFNSLPYSKAYKEKKENELFEIVKSERKNRNIPTYKIDTSNPSTTKHFIYTKPKDLSPIQIFTSLFNVYRKEDEKPWLKNVVNPILRPALNVWGLALDILTQWQWQWKLSSTVWKVAAEVNKPIYAALEKPWVLISKPISSVAKAWTAVYQWAKGVFNEMASVIKENRTQNISSEVSWGGWLMPMERNLETLAIDKKIDDVIKKNKESWLGTFQRGILSTADDFEDNIRKVDILFWTTDSLSDYWTLNSQEEKRRNAIEKAPPEKKETFQKFYDDTMWWQMGNDVVTQVVWWFATWSALGAISKQIANPVVSKAVSTMWDVISKYGMWANEILGAAQAFSALSYYDATGKYLFDDDKEATEAMAWGLFSALIRGGIKTFTKDWTEKIALENIDTDKFMKTISEDDGVRKWFSIMTRELKKAFEEWKQKLWESIEKAMEWQWLVPRIIDEQWVPSSVVNKAPVKDEADLFIETLSKPVIKKDEVGHKKPLSKSFRDAFYERSNEDFVAQLNLPKQERYAALANLEQIKNNGKIEQFKNRLDEIVKPFNDVQLRKLNTLIRLKDRLNKTINFWNQYNAKIEAIKIKNEKRTNLISKTISDWLSEKQKEKLFKIFPKNKLPFWEWILKTKGWTKEKMQAVITKLEEDIDLSEASKQIRNLNVLARQSMYDSWLISKETADAFALNPDYIPSKITQESMEEIWIQWKKFKWDALIKWLKGGSDSLEFDLDNWLTDAFSYYTRIIKAARRNEYIKNIVEIAREQWMELVSKNVPNKKELTRMWYEKYSYKVDGEEVEIMLPKDVIKRLDKNPEDLMLWIKAMQKLTAISKSMISWWLNPFFYVVQLPVEFFLWLLKSIKQWGNLWTFFSTLPKRVRYWVFWTNDEKKISNLISQLISTSWADFAWGRYAQEELTQAFNPLWTWIEWNILTRGAIKTLSRANYVASIFDKWWVRGPAFMADISKQLKEKWISEKQFEKALLSFWETWMLDYNSFVKHMAGKGININISSKVARDIFPYAVVSDSLRLLGTFQPYLNIAAVNLDALIKLLRDGDNKRNKTIIGWIAAMAIWNYYYNHISEDWPWKELAKQDWKIKAQSWLAIQWANWTWKFTSPLTNNNTLYNIIYWLTYLAWETARGNWFNPAEAMAKTWEELLYFDFIHNMNEKWIIKWWFDAVKEKFSVPIFKQAIEIWTNKWLRYWEKIYNEWYWLNDINPRTSDFVKLVAFVVEEYNKMFEEDYRDVWWVKKWGVQFNPAVMSKAIEYGDPTQFPFYKNIKNLLVSEWEEETKDALFKLISRSFKTQEKTIEDIYNTRDAETMRYGLIQNWIKNIVSAAETKEEVKEIFKNRREELIKEYWKDSKEYKYFKNKVIEKMEELEKWKTTFTVQKQSADTIARYMIKIREEEWKEAWEKFWLENRQYLWEQKRENVIKLFKQLKNKKTWEDK